MARSNPVGICSRLFACGQKFSICFFVLFGFCNFLEISKLIYIVRFFCLRWWLYNEFRYVVGMILVAKHVCVSLCIRSESGVNQGYYIALPASVVLIWEFGSKTKDLSEVSVVLTFLLLILRLYFSGSFIVGVF